MQIRPVRAKVEVAILNMAFVVFIGIPFVPGSNKSISTPASPSPPGLDRRTRQQIMNLK